MALICQLADLNRILFDVQKENENNGHRNNKPAAGVPFPGLADVTDILTRIFELTEILAAGQQNAAEKTKLVKELRSLNARSAQAQPRHTSVVFEKPYSHSASLSTDDKQTLDLWAAQCYDIATKKMSNAPPGGLKPSIHVAYEKIFSSLGPTIKQAMTSPLGDILGLLQDIELMLSRVDQQDIAALIIAFIQHKQGPDLFMVYLASQRAIWTRIIV